MNRLFGLALIGGILTSVTTSAGIAEPRSLGHASHEAAVAGAHAGLAPAMAGIRVVVQPSTPTTLSEETARPTATGTQAASAPKPATSVRLVNPQPSAPARPCVPPLHGIVGLECPSK